MGQIKLLLLISGLALVAACQRSSETAPAGGSSGNDYQSSSRGSQSQTKDNPNQYEANNTGRNQRDRSTEALTPENQGGSDADREITRQIRRAVTSDDQLSADAKNVKIMTVNGTVTLRGPVDNAQEQQTVAKLAKGVSGVTSVDNQLEVKQNQ